MIWTRLEEPVCMRADFYFFLYTIENKGKLTNESSVHIYITIHNRPGGDGEAGGDTCVVTIYVRNWLQLFAIKSQEGKSVDSTGIF